jgi:restriction endonuclease Mrr
MAIPDFQTLMRPVLAHLVDGEVRRTRDVKDSMADAFELTADERAQMLPSGRQRTMDNRVGWALTYLRQAGLVDQPARGRVVINAAGRDALASNPDRIDMKTLEAYPAYLDFRERTREKASTDPVPDVGDAAKADSGATPSDLLALAVATNRAAVEGEVLKAAMALSPTGFEDLVIALLSRMGYGRAGSVERTSASGESMTDARGDGLVDKLWSYCDVLRDDGVGVIEYTEQLTYLLFLKMAHERATRKLKPQQIVPEEYSWQKLLDAQGDQLEFEYTRILNGLARQPGVIGTIFRKAQNRIQDPAKLKRLVVDLIDKENWSQSGTDIKGDAYEELLSKGASDKGSGAGQYFTPRALIQAIVDVIQPTVDDTVVDPACGTAGFLLVANEYAEQGAESMTPTKRDKLRRASSAATSSSTAPLGWRP